MMRLMLKSQSHRTTVAGADLDYEQSIFSDPQMMKEAI